MRIAIENKGGKIGFFRIDGRNIKQFVEKAKRDIPDISLMWNYSHIERVNNTQIGVYKNINYIIK